MYVQILLRGHNICCDHLGDTYVVIPYNNCRYVSDRNVLSPPSQRNKTVLKRDHNMFQEELCESIP